jgi:hypothetical protein
MQPPESTRFQKGRSGNPHGRPRRNRLAADIESIFSQTFDLAIAGKRRKVALTEALVWRMSDLALKGDKKAAHAISKFAEKASLVQATPARPRITEICHIIITPSYMLAKMGALKNVDNRWLIESWILKEALMHKPDAPAAIDLSILAESVVDKEFLSELVGARAA